ncbi:MAG: type VI secretion protein [Deltaproteobacteria bacterium]|nr:type VI secretion protein [Deltaproteobacteria bacterium]
MTKKEIIILSLLILIIISIVASNYIFMNRIEEITTRGEAPAEADEPTDNPQLAELKNIHESLATEILRFTTEMNRHATDSPQYILLSSIIAEKQLLDLLILERINTIESNAEVKFVASQTMPNAELASQIASEIDSLTDANDEIKERMKTDDQLNANLNQLTYDSNLLTLSILNRNLMIAKYGLNVPTYTQNFQDMDIVSTTNMLLGGNDKLAQAQLPPAFPAGEAIEAQPGVEPAPEAASPPAPKPSGDDGAGDDVPGDDGPGDAGPGGNGDLLTVGKLAASGRNYRLFDNWALTSEHSVMSDSQNVTILNLAPVRHSANFTKEQASLFIRCENGKTDLAVIFRARLESDYSKGVSVQHRIDQNDTVTSFWRYSTNLQGIFANNPIALIKSLIGAGRVTFRVPRYDSSAVMETYFNLGGLDQAIVPLREACHW